MVTFDVCVCVSDFCTALKRHFTIQVSPSLQLSVGHAKSMMVILYI